MTQYWIKTSDKIQGPFRGSQVKQLASEGKLRKKHQISTDQERWRLADSINGLEFKDEELPVEAAADVHNEELDEPFKLAPEKPLPTREFSGDQDANPMPMAANSDSRKCPKCSADLMVIRIADVLTTTTVCVACDVSPGACPVCGETLGSIAAQQCFECHSHWHPASLLTDSEAQSAGLLDEEFGAVQPLSGAARGESHLTTETESIDLSAVENYVPSGKCGKPSMLISWACKKHCVS